jgi:CdiI immunity protein
MDTKSKFPKLCNLLGAYFHQDWKYDYDWKQNQPNFEEVVRFYKISNPVNTVSQATEELRKFLNLQLTEADLDDILQGIGVCYNPKARKMTYHQWLESILHILEDSSDNISYLQETEDSVWTGWQQYAEL